ncbi:MAG: arginine--tRNA ligase [Lachnospiraceae bacterium]|nr:arginine--tRNA ligase [Lachnospiraceae bacterium]MCM1238380.1 arginine--tRNA ligase [Lachnospiraceae bacterium]MCM1303546.1 arginine--tRNA ligase [Butyrivibrio sp.]MCM1343270.1 arginine--tRNA ligase [Muribaculaceae bacterium]MCM1409302.1 arginine--tRNA ligase [Lachnospiraceae bacterium]
MRELFCEKAAEVLEEISEEQLRVLLEVPTDETMGDYAIPCFALAKEQRRSPAVIAAEFREILSGKKEELAVSRVENVGGYCNIFVDRAKFTERCFAKLSQQNHGFADYGAGGVICMDYSSPNIAKNFHAGHLRTTIIGNSLYKIFTKLGYSVVRINYLGDWGTQFGKLITAYQKWSSRETVEERGIEELLELYVKLNAEAEKSPELIEEARAWFIRMEQNDEEALAIWNWFREISMQEFERVYKMLGISFDTCVGESFYRDKVPALIEELKRKNLLEESQGALVVNLNAYNMPPCLITKSDGGSIYHSRDIAAVLDRKKTYGFEKCLYVTGAEQALHFKQVFQAVELMGYSWADELIHVPFGLVSLDGEKLSSRKGNVIYAEDILKEAVERAMEQIQKKNPSLADKESTADKVGVGAVIFHDLYNQRIKNVDFSWEEVLNFEGNTGPYVQYTYARAKSILRKAGNRVKPADINYHMLTDDAAFSLIKILSEYEDTVISAARNYEPSVIARYLIALASAFNHFYHEVSILQAAEEEKDARILLVTVVQDIIRDACGLLGMKCPEEM